jgi:hypothetical protein
MLGMRFVLLGMLMACATEIPPAPPVKPAATAPAPLPPALSRFSVPLEYDFTAVLRLVEQVVPKQYGSMDSVHMMGTDERRHYAFQAVRGPFTAFADGNLLHLRTTLAYSARGFYKPPMSPTISAGCGDGAERPRIIVELATPISLSPNWHLVSHARIVSVAPASTEQRDHCDVSILHKDVTACVVEAARSGLESQLGNIDRKVGAVDLTGHAREWWAMLGQPIQLADGVWLTLGPERLRAGRVTGHSRILTVPVSLDARPRIVTGRTPPAAGTGVLPPLGHDSASGGFHIVIDGIVDYAKASQELTAALGGKTFSEKGHAVTVHDVSAMPLPDGQLALTVAFTGATKGTLRLLGTPLYDRAHMVISVPDLDFDLHTDSRILQTYSWLKSGGLRAQLRQKARIPVTDALERGRGLLLDGLNRKIGDAVTLSATVDSVAVRGIFVTSDGLDVRAEAKGHAGVAVKQH